jgi:hypothetical protein
MSKQSTATWRRSDKKAIKRRRKKEKNTKGRKRQV